MSAVVRVIAVAAVFAAAPAIADNTFWDPTNSRWSGFYAETPLQECQSGTEGDLELRACLSRLLLEAESHYQISFDTLETLVAEREDDFQQAEEAEALRFARETWRSYLDFQCDFEGAMLGAAYSARSLQATSCRVSLLRQQAARFTELAGQIDPGGANPDWTDDPETCVGPFCAVETETFRDWTARCRRGGLCGAVTTTGSEGRIEVIARPAGDGWSIIFSSDAHPVDSARAIAVRVDGRNPVVFEPYRDYSANGDGAFVLSDVNANSRLITAMRRGNRITVQYVDVDGRDRLATFSLLGVTRSLSWIEARIGRLR
jgi:hypothetical protein